jgi:purine-nucleoside phosphorylase
VTAFDRVREAAARLKPRTAVVLGSGLGGVTAGFTVEAEAAYAEVPWLPPPTVAGHSGRLTVGTWAGGPAVVCSGRVHFYEGHPWATVTRLVELVADLGVTTLLLTNAAGGIRPGLNPGDLMVISAHLKLIGPTAWTDFSPRSPYSPHLLDRLQSLDPQLPSGVYAALTGPCYETPAEIRALAAAGADAVGMSTAVEAEAAAARGLEVAAISTITNKAAGLGVGPLSHAEVEQTANLAVARLGSLVQWFVAGN